MLPDVLHTFLVMFLHFYTYSNIRDRSGSCSLSLLYASSLDIFSAMISAFSVSWFVLLCSSHFVGSFMSSSHLECICHQVILVVRTYYAVRVETCSSLFQ